MLEPTMSQFFNTYYMNNYPQIYYHQPLYPIQFDPAYVSYTPIKPPIHPSMEKRFMLPKDWIWFSDYTRGEIAGYSKLERKVKVPKLEEDEIWFYESESWVAIKESELAGVNPSSLYELTTGQGHRLVWKGDLEEHRILDNEMIFGALFDRFNQKIFTVEAQVSIIEGSILGVLEWTDIAELMRMYMAQYAGEMTEMYHTEKDYALLRANRVPDNIITLLRKGFLKDTETCINKCSGNSLYVLWKKFIIDKFNNSCITAFQFMKAYDPKSRRSQRQYARSSSTELYSFVNHLIPSLIDISNNLRANTLFRDLDSAKIWKQKFKDINHSHLWMRNQIHSYYIRFQNMIELLNCLHHAKVREQNYVICPQNPILDTYNLKTQTELVHDVIFEYIMNELNALDADLGYHN
jgi:hypothetical protein